MTESPPSVLCHTIYAARLLLEKVARLGDCIGQQTVTQVQQLAKQASAWLRDNPPGQAVAIEPRGCPAPGACSCVEPPPPAPEDLAADQAMGAASPPLPPDYIDPEHHGDARELLEVFYRACQAEGGTADEIHLRGIRAVLAARPTAPRVPEVGEVGKLVAWLTMLRDNPTGIATRFDERLILAATLLQQPSAAMHGDTHWLPANALPLPQGDQLEQEAH